MSVERGPRIGDVSEPGSAQSDDGSFGWRLDFSSAATAWCEGLPIGNGRLGAMVTGGPTDLALDLNDDRCWSGSPVEPAPGPTDGPEVLAEVRQLLAESRWSEADRVVRRLQRGHSQAFQPLAKLRIDLPGEPQTALARSLDLRRSVARHEAGWGSAECWASSPDQAITVRISLAESSDVAMQLVSPHSPYGVTDFAPGDDAVVMTTRMPSDVSPPHDRIADPVTYDPDRPGLTAALALHVTSDGRVTTGGAAIHVAAATWVEIVVTSEVAVGSISDDAVVGRARQVSAIPYRDRLARHTDDVTGLFDRFSLDLGGDGSTDVAALLAKVADGELPARLVELHAQYGRYLLIASSRAGTTATHLQGLWNAELVPPWSCNNTVNINTEMNYWLAETTGLPELVEPLLGLVQLLAKNGQRVARDLYGMPGWCCHHNTDAWGFCDHVGTGNHNPAWAMWPMAGLWLLHHLEEHCRFAGTSPSSLPAEQRAAVAGAVTFALAWLVRLPDGSWGTSPSTSPENTFLAEAGVAGVTVSSTMDVALVRNLLRFWLAVTAMASPTAEEPSREAAEAALASLPAPEPTVRGTYPEWSIDLPEVDPLHRHQSQLWDIHPGAGVTTVDPAQRALVEAARETLRVKGFDSTGWSLAWRICLHARLGDGESAARSMAGALRLVGAGSTSSTTGGGVYASLLCAHPPFQIDGNHGFTAGVVECLVQSHAVVDDQPLVQLLPALPESWSRGSVSGVRVRGGLVIDLTWNAGQVTRLVVRGSGGTRSVVVEGPGLPPRVLAAGEEWHA